MEVEFADAALDRLEMDPKFTAGYGPAVVRGFRKAIQHLRAAHDERDLYASKGFHFEKLKGREPERSLRINKQWRLVLELKDGERGRTALVLAIEDYH